ncbi:osmoprotectant transport system permease protein [Crossiella equi]|uniref:Osmoprotectant transport system permease protein n=1 Tax=Crossiella equi TaxID=130796 RepID=A0ABS5AFW1_9PSEU|nr:ABC transporter permease [Crossiella equi]MBP2475478.1 osmoprotectant transport system permease protein [Crossiella equi]
MNSERLRLFAEPIAVLVLVAAVLTWAFTGDLDTIERRNITWSNILELTWQHLQLTVAIAAIVLLVGVPLGVLVSRKWARYVAPVVLGLANIGQAAPAVGVLVLFFLATGQTGFWIAVLPMAVYALLPVLRNTLVGLQQVDPTLVEAGRGIGMSSFAVLRRIEFPLAIPHVLAGMRTALVLGVGVATLAMFVNGGGLGVLIDTGYKLRRTSVLVVGAVLSAALALLVDWLGGLAERKLGPKGLR